MIVRALFTNYAHLYRLCITHIWHSTSTMRRFWFWCITNMLLSSAPSVVNNSHVMSLSDWLLLSHFPVLMTTATSSLWVSWCPVRISAAAVSPSCGNTYCVELEATWSRPLHCVNSTGFQPLRGYSLSCVCCYTTHVTATLRSICHIYWRQSLTIWDGGCNMQFYPIGK